jgi:hypothetical protein
MLALMFTPALMAIALALLLRGRHATEQRALRVRGVWIAFAAFAVHLVVKVLWSRHDLEEAAVNRSGAAAVLLLMGYFVWVNRTRARSTVIGVWLVACGAGLNAAATLAYGAMPALGSAARTAGYDDIGSEGHPFDGYVLSDHMSPIARYMGDFIPIPDQLKVLSIGDLMLIAGLVIVLIEAIRSVAKSPLVSSDSA